MGLNINKRLRYFNTEAEYLAYVEAQRVAAEAGTLELMETTVCCIKHNDDTTPDEYHPSTEAGYTDVVFNYNEDDDIRYVPFINPMWTERNISLRPTENGYMPIFTNVTSSDLGKHTLPDVIDGQQIVYIDENFTKYLNRWPQFSISNVKYLSYNGGSSDVLDLPQRWPSLITFNLTSKLPTFDGTRTIIAPKLETFSWSSSATDPSQLPILDSSSLREFKMINIRNPLTWTELNLDNVILDTSSLEEVSIGSNNAFESIILNHTGEYLHLQETLGTTLNLEYTNDNTKAINIGIISPNTVTCQTLRLKCDFNTSTCSCTFNNDRLVTPQSKKLSLVDCISTANENTNFGGLVVHSQNYLNVLENFTDVTTSGCAFSTMEFNITRSRGFQKINPSPVTASQKCIVNINYDIPKPNTSYTLGKATVYNSIPETVFDELTINFSSENPWIQNEFHGCWINIPARKLKMSGTVYYSPNYIKIYQYYTVDSKIPIYVSPLEISPEIKLTGKPIDYFIPHANQLGFTIREETESVDGVLEAIKTPSLGSWHGQLELNIFADCQAFNFTINLSESYHFDYVDMSCTTPSVSVSTIGAALRGVNNLLDIKTETSPTRGVLYIHRTLYKALSAEELAIANKFNTIDIFEDDEVS